MAIPIAPVAPEAGGSLTATFRLDSLTQGGELAWLSLHGTLEHTTTVRADLRGAIMELGGDLSGTLALDRRRGWITDARIDLRLRSTITPTSSASSGPMHLRMSLSQRMRVH